MSFGGGLEIDQPNDERDIEVVSLATGTEGARDIVGNPHDCEDVANCVFRTPYRMTSSTTSHHLS